MRIPKNIYPAIVTVITGCAALTITSALTVNHTTVKYLPSPSVTVTRAMPAVTITKWKTVYVTASPAAAAPVSSSINGQWEVFVNCFQHQCTTLPDAGPGGSTCSHPSTGEQRCLGDGAANYQAALNEGATPPVG